MELFKIKKTLISKRGFSLVELLVVITIVGILGAVSFVAIQRTKTRSLNERMLDDLVAIANSLEDYRQDHQGSFPIPTTANNQNVLCFYADATYADCEDADVSFIQGMIDNNLLTKRYLREVPTDPRTGSRYVYGVSEDGKFYQVAGLYEASDDFEARTVGNLAKGFELPSLIRAYDGPNFVVDGEDNLPYPSDRMTFTGTLDNINGTLWVNGSPDNVRNGLVVKMGDTLKAVGSGSSVDIYLSDGSVTHLESGDSTDGELILKSLSVEKNDGSGTVTKILLRLNLGKIWSKVARLASASEFRVETSSSIAGVRGTEFGVEEFGGATQWKVRVKSGTVWGGKKADLGIVQDPSPEVVFAMPKPDISSSLIYTDSINPEVILDPADPLDAAYYAPYYASIALTANHRPHILSIYPGALGHNVTVRNVNFFANQINDRLGITDPAQKRHVRVTRLAAYDASTMDTATPTLITATGDIATQQTGIYTLNITSLSPLALRFELCSNNPQPAQACDLIRASSVATLPALTSSTNLTEAQLYPNLAPSVEGLEISAPDTVALTVAGTDQTFTVSGTIQGYSLNASGPCTATTSSLVTYSQPGACVLTATAILSNGATATATKTVTIAPATAVLSLGAPRFYDDGLIRHVAVPWSANNPPQGAEFMAKINTKNILGAATNPIDDSVIPGDNYVVWLFMYRDNDNNNSYGGQFSQDELLESAYTPSFRVPVGSAPSAEFVIPTIPPLIAETQVRRPLESPTKDSAFTYAWTSTNPGVAFTAPVAHTTEMVIDSALPPPGVSATYSVTLTIREAGNVATPPVTRTVTVRRLGEITGIALVPTPASNLSVEFGSSVTLGAFSLSATANPPMATNLPATCVASIGGVTASAGVLTYAAPASGTANVAATVTCQVAPVPAGYALSSSAQPATFDIAVTMPAPVLTAATMALGVTQAYYAVNTPIAVETQDLSDISILSSEANAVAFTATPDAVTGVATFTPANPGTYTLTGRPAGAHTAPVTITVKVCGYAGVSGGECWILGNADQPCSTYAPAVGAPVTGVCDAASMVCPAQDWNDCGANGTCGIQAADVDDCEICKLITGATACGIDLNTFAPLNIITNTGTKLCRYRQSVAQDCGTTPTTTFQGATAKRICKCQ